VKALTCAVIAAVLLALEAVVVRYLGLSISRIDVTLTIVAALSMRAAVVEGATASFCVGYLLDLMSGRPTGLYTFLAVLMFLLLRLADTFVEVRRAGGFAMLAAGGEFVHQVLAAFFSWMTSKDERVFTASLRGLPTSVLLTGVAGLLLFPLLMRFIPQTEQTKQMSLLR
jgi:cell shape-determining protein MreD